LLFFGAALRRLRLSTMGFLQYVGPTLQFAVATGLLVYPQAAHLEHFEPRRTRQLMTGTGYIARVGRWLRESF